MCKLVLHFPCVLLCKLLYLQYLYVCVLGVTLSSVCCSGGCLLSSGRAFFSSSSFRYDVGAVWVIIGRRKGLSFFTGVHVTRAKEGGGGGAWAPDKK